MRPREQVLDGRLTMATVPGLVKRGLPALSPGETLQLDLSKVDYADSAGVALLLELQRRAQAAGARLQLCGAPAQLRRLAQFFAVDELLTFAS